MALTEPPFSPNQRLMRMLLCVFIGAVIWFSHPPAGMSLEGWRVLAVFVATIASFLLRPYPMGPMVLVALTFLAVTDTMTFKEVITGYSHKLVWLVVAAFFIASAVENTDLGRRIALSMVRLFGSSTIGLGYATVFSELILGPFVPSNTARVGGIMSPIIGSLSRSLDSHPEIEPDRLGSYLVLTAVHANLFTCSMFLTGMAANPLVVAAASSVYDVDFTWSLWALGAVVPGLLGIVVLPLFIYHLQPPTMHDVSAAKQNALKELEQMGPWSYKQKVMLGVFLFLTLLWLTPTYHGLETALVAWVGVCIILVSRTELWRQMVINSYMWDAVIWIGGLIVMADRLRDLGVMSWIAENLQYLVSGGTAVTMVVALAIFYYYLMYGFSMLTGHITALLIPFFAVLLAVDAPPMLTIALFAYFSNLCAALTHYSTGSTIIYFGLGYVPVSRWLSIGFLVSLYHMVIWLGIGLVWWKLLGWW